MARVATARGAHGVMLGIGALLVLAALGHTPPAFAQTQPTPPQASAPAANSPPPAQASAQVPPAPPVAPASERYTTNEDYATERLAAVKLHQMKEMLKALPLLEDLYAKNQHDVLVLEYLTTALLARSATQTDPSLATKDTVRAKAMIDRARALGDQSQLAENLSESLKNVTEKSTLSFSSKADVEAAMKAGEAAFAKNDFDEAIKDYKHAVELDPSNYFATLFVGDAYFSKKDFVPAGEWYTKAQVLDPDIETAFRYHADMLAKQGDYAGARKLCFEAIVASPYESKTWRQLVEWGKLAHVTPQRVHIETGGSVTPTDKGANITLDASQPVDVSAVWFAYNGTRALWRDKFKQAYPNETQYRHSLAEEVDALTTAATVAEQTAGRKGSQAIAKDPNIQLLLKIYHAKLLEPYVLLNGADQGIAQDYVAYRAANRPKLIEYLGTFVAPETAK
jgi:tetratricopeptide (TPR) repeat protein